MRAEGMTEAAHYNVVKECTDCGAPFAIAVRAENTLDAQRKAKDRPVKRCPRCQERKHGTG